MARTSAMQTAEANVRSAIITFLTTTLPPIALASHNQAIADDRAYVTTNLDPDQAFYSHCKTTLDRYIALGIVAGPNPLPYR